MLNKKILATAVALACSTTAFADVDLDATASQTVTIATESLGTAPGATVEVTNAGGALDVAVETGFTTGDGTSNFVRFDLTNATFSSSTPALTFPGAAGTPTAVISQGGADGDAFVIFEIVATGGDLLNDDDLLLSAATYDVSSTATSTVTYGFYDVAADAVGSANELASADSSFTSVASAVTGDYTDAGVGVATVASTFTQFDPETADETTLIANIGEVVPGQVVKAGSIKLDGSPYTVADLIPAGAQTITFAGDFSFGDFSLLATDCSTAGTTNLMVNTAETEATISADPATQTTWAFCVVLDGTEEAEKGTYTITLATPEVENTIGQITFDTTTVEVPYLTTFDSYNQRMYIINRGSRAALYTISFISEDGVTATAEAGATGSVPANEVLALRASDIVSLTGRTRTAATVEIEAEASVISVATQQVNLADGTTDTVVLK